MNRILSLISSALIIFSGCTKLDDLQNPELDKPLDSEKYSLTGYSDIQTKTSFDEVSEGKVPFLWEIGDFVWLNENKSESLSTEGNKAVFTFDNAPSTEEAYNIYYNITGNSSKAIIPNEQTQSTAFKTQLGKNGDFGHAKIEAADRSFTLKHHTSYIWFNAYSKDISTKLSSITITAANGAALAGTASFDGEKLEECSGTSSITLKFNGDGIALPKESQDSKILAAMVVYPADLSSSLLSIEYNFSDGSVYMSTKPGKQLVAGMTQKISTEIKAAECVKDGLYYFSNTGWTTTLPETFTDLKVTTLGNARLTLDILTKIKDYLKANTDIHATIDLKDATYESEAFPTIFSSTQALKSISIPKNITSIFVDEAQDYDGFKYCRNLETFIYPVAITAFPKMLFYECDALKNITIHSGIKSIEDMAFYRCKSLEKVTFPENLEKIGYRAFAQCNKLSSDIIIPAKVSILDGTFDSCPIENVTLHDNITEIGDYTFNGCSLIKEITLPANLKELGIYAFRNCKLIKKIIIPEGVTTLKEEVFSGCAELEEIIFNDNITAIEEEAFYKCGKIKELNLPKYLEKLGERAFYECNGLTDIYLNAKIIGPVTFWGCENLKKIEFGPRVEKIRGNTFVNAGQNADMIISRAINAPTIESGAFGDLGRNITTKKTLLVPAASFDDYDAKWQILQTKNNFSIEEISNQELAEGIYYKALRTDNWSENIPESFNTLYVKSIDNATLNTENLNNIVTKVNAQANPVELDLRAAKYSETEFPAVLKNSTKLKAIILFENTTSIAASAFEGTTELVEITLPSGITTIKEATFKGATKLKKVNNYSNLNIIEKDAFNGASSLGDYMILMSAETIGESAFKGCGFVEVKLASTKTLGKEAFANCLSLNSLQIGTALTEISEAAFKGATSLNTVEFPKNIVKIGTSAFEGANLSKIEIPESITSIGNFAFKGNVNATEILVPSTLTVLPEGIFDGNNVITEFKLPETITELGVSAFGNWTKLEKLNIPNGVLNKIGSKAFEKATQLSSIYSEVTTAPSIADDTFLGAATSVTGDKKIYVADVEAYSSWTTAATAAGYTITKFDENYLSDGLYYRTNDTEKWSSEIPATFTTISVKSVGIHMNKAAMDALAAAVKALTNTASIDMSEVTYESQIFPASFKSNTNLVSIIFPSNITEVAQTAFSGTGFTSIKVLNGIKYNRGVYSNCNSLTEITFEEGVTTIATNMFQKCNALVNLTLINSIEKIESNAFNACKLLSNLSLGAVKRIETSAFQACPALTEVILPDATEYLGQNTFGDCDKLAKISFGTGMKTIEAYCFTGYSKGCPLLGNIICRGTNPATLKEDYGTSPFAGSWGVVAGQNATERIVHLPKSDDPDNDGDGAYVDSNWSKLLSLKKAFTFVYDIE